MSEDTFLAEDQEQQDSYFSKQAKSEFSQIIAKKRYEARLGKLTFLRMIGRQDRLKLNQKYGKRWQEAVA